MVGVSVLSGDGGPTERGVLLELIMTPSSLEAGAELFRTNTPTRNQIARFEWITFDDTGRWVAVGEGLVVSATTASGRPQLMEFSSAFDPFDVRATGLESRPFVIAGKNILRWGSPFPGENVFEDFPLSELGPGTRRNLAIDVSLDGGEVAIDILRSTVELSHGKSGGSGWEDRPVRVSDAPVLCQHDWRCGRPSASVAGNMVVAAAPSIGNAHYVSPESCSAVYLSDARGDCAISADVELFETTPAGDRDKGRLFRGARNGERAAFTGQRGRILEARLEP